MPTRNQIEKQHATNTARPRRNELPLLSSLCRVCPSFVCGDRVAFAERGATVLFSLLISLEPR